jgi:hypothetical protein
VEADGPIHFRFAVDSSRRIKAVGELAGKDETGKTGGLRFTELPDEIREYIRAWSNQTKASVLDVPIAEPAKDASVASSSEADLASIAGVPVAEPTLEADAAPGGEIKLAPLEDIAFVEPEAEAETATRDEMDSAPPAQGERRLLYNARLPVYSAPSYDLSMFSAASKSEAALAMAAQRGPFPSRHPIAALILTIFLASVVGTGIFAYVSTSQAGDVLYYLGEKVWEEFHSQPAPGSSAMPADSKPDSSNAIQR